MATGPARTRVGSRTRSPANCRDGTGRAMDGMGADCPSDERLGGDEPTLFAGLPLGGEFGYAGLADRLVLPPEGERVELVFRAHVATTPR